MRTPKTYTEDMIAGAIAIRLRQVGYDPDVCSARFEVDANGKVSCVMDVGQMRWAVTVVVDGIRTVIGWGDTEAEALKMARQHPKWAGHNLRYKIGEDIFARIAGGDFDASKWTCE